MAVQSNQRSSENHLIKKCLQKLLWMNDSNTCVWCKFEIEFPDVILTLLYLSQSVLSNSKSTPWPKLPGGLVASVLVKTRKYSAIRGQFPTPSRNHPQRGWFFHPWRVGRTNLAAGRENCRGKILRPTRHRGAWIIYYERRRWIAGEARRIAEGCPPWSEFYGRGVCLIMAAAGSPGHS